MTFALPTPIVDYTWQPPTLDDLKAFSGVEIASLYIDVNFCDVILQQASDLFFLACEVEHEPNAKFEQRLKKNAILEMAQALYLIQPFKNVLASPFASERIGNYSYSKLKDSLADGVPIGLSWFDEAVMYFVQDIVPENTSTRGMEDDNIWVTPGDEETEEVSRQLLGPMDLQPDPFGGQGIPRRGGRGGRYGGGGWDVWPPQP